MVRRFVASAAAAVIALSAMLQPANAQSRGGLNVVRDTEVEQTIRTYATPLFRAAGLDPTAVRIILVNDRALNAFVAGGQNLFINTGLLLRAAHPGQVIGVLAHETGHIAGGHLARMPEAYRNAMITSLLSMLLGAAAAAAGGGRGDVGGAVMTGGASMAQRSLFAFTRSQEQAADQAGITFLEQTGQSARGFLEFMEILANQEFMSASRQDPYLRTHPLSSERVEFLRNQVARSPNSSLPVPPDFIRLHTRMKAKLAAFLDPPSTTLQKFPETDASFEARYARAIALYRIPDLPAAIAAVDRLIAQYPTDPYLYELKGQMLFENGRAADALPVYQRAVELMPTAPLFRIDLAQAQLELNDPRLIPAALGQLNDASRVENRNSKLWRLLAIAYGRDNQIGMASMALAEQALLEGRRRDARDQARRALRMLPEGSPGWLRAQDLEVQALREEEEERR